MTVRRQTPAARLQHLFGEIEAVVGSAMAQRGDRDGDERRAARGREVRLPESAVLPHARGLSAPFSCLNEARYGIAWGAIGAARDSFDQALAVAQDRTQFGRPVAGFQLTQEKLVNMALEIQKAQLVALRIGRLKDAGRALPHMISFAKLNNTRIAIDVARTARTILGGNGVTLDYSPLRHASNLESVRTYEGTDEVHTLILGQRITGLAAFR